MKLHVRWGLGVSGLLPEWKNFFSKKDLWADLTSGVTVALIAIPLSLAIALASHVEPGLGLLTAIIAGIVAAFFGGTRLAVSGPAAAMAVLIAASVEQFGLPGLIFIGLGCGLLQILFGVLGLGKVVSFVPVPVIGGFTAGIGVIILIGQLPRALGLPPPDQGHVIEVMKHVGRLVAETDFRVLSIALSTLFLAKILPRINSKIPAPLIAVLVPSVLVAIFGIDVPLLGAIPRGFPPMKLPSFPDAAMGKLIGTTFIVFAVGSLETLLSSAALDKMVKTVRHDPDQELIGQGMANVVVSLFGGIPVTGVIARSALNVRAGARTRRSAIIHSLCILLAVMLIAPVIERIPVATLAGMLISVAISMLNWKELRQLIRTSRTEAFVYVVTFAAMVLIDLLGGVQVGIAAALLVAVLRLGQLKISMHSSGPSSPYRVFLAGPITFLASSRFHKIADQLKTDAVSKKTIIDLNDVTLLDSSGAESLLDFVSELKSAKFTVVLKSLSAHSRQILTLMDGAGVTLGCYAETEEEVGEVLGIDWGQAPRDRILSGVERFRTEVQGEYAPLFKKQANRQFPHTLFVTCSDSRIVPNLITSTDPGELFIIRNVGNIMPKWGSDQTPAEGAAVEYAVHILGIKEVIICGHFSCGAMGTLFTEVDPVKFPCLALWLEALKDVKKECKNGKDPDIAAGVNVLQQLDNLRDYPGIRDLVEAKRLQLRGWVYDVKTGDVFEWSEEDKLFTLLKTPAKAMLG